MQRHRTRIRSIVGGLLTVAALANLAAQATAQIALETETQKLLASDTLNSPAFGATLAVQGDQLFVGTPGDNLGFGSQGSVRVVHWDGTAWVETDLLSASDGGPFDTFGRGLAVAQDLLVVGASNHDHPGTVSQGTVYAFGRHDGRWVEEQHLFPAGVDLESGFGLVLAASGERAFVFGSIDTTQPEQPAIFVFRRTPTGWIEETPILLDVPPFGQLNRPQLAASGDLLAFGSTRPTGDGHFEPGTVRVFEFDGAAWSLQSTLVASDGAANDSFGAALAFSGERLAVGAPLHDATPDGNEGALYVFHREGERWVEEPISGLGATPTSLLGHAVAIEGSTLAAASDTTSPGEIDATHVFRWTGTEWRPAHRLGQSDPNDFDAFAFCLALRGPMLLAGNPNDTTGPLFQSPHGSVYTFDMLPPGWSFRGGSAAGAQGHPVLTAVGELDGGDLVTLRLEQAAAGAPVLLVIGLSALQAPFKGGVLVPHPDAVVDGLASNGAGELVLSHVWPSLPPGTSVFLQHWIADASAPQGLAASNGVRALVP